MTTKQRILAGGLICTLLLGGSYIAYSNYSSSKEVIDEQESIVMPKDNKKTTIPKSTKKKPSIAKTIPKKDSTTNSSVDSFRDFNSNNFQSERSSALNQLNRQIGQEKESQKNTPVLVNTPVLATNNSNKEGTQSKKPSPILPEKPVTPPVQPEKPVDPPVTPDPPVINVDYSVLASLVEYARTVDLSNYFSKGAHELETELIFAERMLTELSSSQVSVDNQVARVKNALENLIQKGDKSELQKIYSESLLIDEDIYTPETIAQLTDAKNQTKTVLDTVEVTQETIDGALQQLKTAVDGLTKKEEPYLSLVYLQRLVNELNTLDKTLYTPSSVASLEAELPKVMDYLAKETYTRQENETYQKLLEGVKSNLKSKADKTALQNLVNSTNSLDKAQYTTESVSKLEAVLVNANTALSNDEISQSEIDALYNELQHAITNLEKISEIASLVEPENLQQPLSIVISEPLAMPKVELNGKQESDEVVTEEIESFDKNQEDKVETAKDSSVLSDGNHQ